jgi:hypothetical protein
MAETCIYLPTLTRFAQQDDDKLHSRTAALAIKPQKAGNISFNSIAGK